MIVSANGETYAIIDIFDVYKVDSSSENVHVQYYGNWSDVRYTDNSLLVTNDIMWKRRGNLNGYHIR